MAVRTITLTKQANSFSNLPMIRFVQGEAVVFRLTDSDADLNGSVMFFNIKEGLAVPNTTITNNPQIITNSSRNLTVASGFANWSLPSSQTTLLGGSNKIYTLQIQIRLPSGIIQAYGKYECRVAENIISGIPAPVNILNYLSGNPNEFWLSPRQTAGRDLTGSNITQLNDLTGNNEHFAQATVANQPTIDNTGINGVPCARFDGINDVLVLPNLTETIFTKIFVVSINTTAGKILDAPSSSYLFTNISQTSEIQKTLFGQRNATSNWGTTGVTNKIIVWQYGGTNATTTLTINGGANILTAGSVDAGVSAKTVNNVLLGGGITGLIGDVMNFTRILSPSEVSEIVASLNSIYTIF